jgi:hypothetical protein
VTSSRGRRRPFGEVAAQPAQREALSPLAVVTRHQSGQPERLVEAEVAALARSEVGEDEAAGFKCPVELWPRVSVLAQGVSPSWGRTVRRRLPSTSARGPANDGSAGEYRLVPAPSWFFIAASRGEHVDEVRTRVGGSARDVRAWSWGELAWCAHPRC